MWPARPDAKPWRANTRNAAARRSCRWRRSAATSARGIARGDGRAHARNQFAAVVDRVVERIEAADQEGRHAEVVVVEQRVGDLLGRADERRRIRARAGQLRDLGPQPLVDARAALGGGQQAARAFALQRAAGAEAGRFAQPARFVEDPVRARPCVVLGRGEDRAERHREAHLPAVLRRFGAHARRQVAHLVERFAPQRVDVRVSARDRERRVRRAAEIDRHVRLLVGPHVGIALAKAVMRAFVVERLRVGPDPAQDAEVFVGARVAGVVVEEIAVTLLFGVGAARDDVHREPAAAELVERRDLARGKRRRGEARTMREHEVNPLGRGGRVCDRQRRRRPGRVVRHEDAVEAGRLVCAGEVAHVVGIDRVAGRRVNLRLLLALDHADEFDAHLGLRWVFRYRAPATGRTGAQITAGIMRNGNNQSRIEYQICMV
ncbi:hypothetical protein BGV59_13110 [Burkholderia ubonensis]|nr:hypothetical protein BGV59_13110 [Burkholderia ubonensis]